MNALYFILIILGLVQGIAEFLPISSSGHLVIIEQLPFIANELSKLSNSSNLFINVALHVATLMAVIIYLWKDIVTLFTGFFTSIYKGTYRSPEFKSAIYIIIASIPAGIAGLLFNDLFEKIFSSALTAFSMLIINGIVLINTNKIVPKNRNIEEIGLVRSILIGCFQAIAILPGISRSGMTIAGGMFNGLKPIESAKFSFLMAIPVIAGAGFLEGMKACSNEFPGDLILPIIISMIITCIVALISLRILFALVKQIRINIFGYYTITVGIIGLIALLIF